MTYWPNRWDSIYCRTHWSKFIMPYNKYKFSLRRCSASQPLIRHEPPSWFSP